jgi:hypothetical protein
MTSLVISVSSILLYILINDNLINDFSTLDTTKVYGASTETINEQLVIYENNQMITIKSHLKDFRAVVFDEYLRRNASPLLGLGEEFVAACDKYDAPKDCTVVLAIARAETDLCKYPPSQTQKNCWGFGGSGANRWYFSNYAEGIDVVTDRLANRYGYEYMVDPDAMEMTYCGQRDSCTKWGELVQKFMDEINRLSVEMGYKDLYSLRTKQ